eukprot:735833-Pyramimonas_sp.AAC.1
MACLPSSIALRSTLPVAWCRTGLLSIPAPSPAGLLKVDVPGSNPLLPQRLVGSSGVQCVVVSPHIPDHALVTSVAREPLRGKDRGPTSWQGEGAEDLGRRRHVFVVRPTPRAMQKWRVEADAAPAGGGIKRAVWQIGDSHAKELQKVGRTADTVLQREDDARAGVCKAAGGAAPPRLYSASPTWRPT